MPVTPWNDGDTLPDLRPVLAAVLLRVRSALARLAAPAASTRRPVADDAHRPHPQLYVIEADPDGRDRDAVQHDSERTFEYVACWRGCGRALLVAGDPVVFAWTCYECRWRNEAHAVLRLIEGGGNGG